MHWAVSKRYSDGYGLAPGNHFVPEASRAPATRPSHNYSRHLSRLASDFAAWVDGVLEELDEACVPTGVEKAAVGVSAISSQLLTRSALMSERSEAF